MSCQSTPVYNLIIFFYLGLVCVYLLVITHCQ
ncbi:unnamed protein product, partial [Staurois parvus]